MKAKTAVFLFLTVFVLAPVSARGADLWVAPAGSDTGNNCSANTSPCLSLQHAVDQAATGDRICVVQGTYFENVTIDKKIAGLTVRGGYSCAAGACTHTPDPALTIVDGGDVDRAINVLRFHAGEGTIRFEYLTLQNGKSGGLSVSGGFGSPSRITVADCIVKDNQTTRYGGGLYVGGMNVILEILDSTIRGNSAQRGGGVAAECGNPSTVSTQIKLIMKRNRLQLNSASADGGGIYIESANPLCTTMATLEGNIIGHDNVIDPTLDPVPNTAFYGGGMYVYSILGGRVEIEATANTINANHTKGRGAGVITSAYLPGSTIKGQFRNNIFSWNSSDHQSAMGVESNQGKQTIGFYDNIVSLNGGSKTPGETTMELKAWSAGEILFEMSRNTLIWNQQTTMLVDVTGPSTSIDARFDRNYIAGNSSGVNIRAENRGTATVAMQNNVIGNQGSGDGIFLVASGQHTNTDPGGDARLYSLNDTIANNRRGIYVTAKRTDGNARVELTNTIVWGNTEGDIHLSEDDTEGNASTFVSARYCDIGTVTNAAPPRDGTYKDLGNNISKNPLFINPFFGDFGLSPPPALSPAADAAICGTSDSPGAYTRIAPLVDFHYHPRPPASTTAILCDIGADEIDHCADTSKNFGETGVDCGGGRCAPCGCKTDQHAKRVCGFQSVLFADIAAAYADIAASGICKILSHKMEFGSGLALTKTSPDGQPIEVKLSGGWDCAMNSRSPGDVTTIAGQVVIGGDTLIEADGISIR